ncbi:hypothetical protein CNR22_20080 [Sphingobacteriaceae bacterium]|nr:hypothetical protein CNR22_20080 [Sphingobacteriaceae bacterium]
MLRKDYIQRQFEQFGKVLASLLAKKLLNDYDAFEKEMAEAVKQFTDFEILELENISLDAFSQKINSSHLEFDQKKILANLLFEKMTYYQEIGDLEHYKALKLKTLFLYQVITDDLTHNEFDLEAHYRLDRLKKEL